MPAASAPLRKCLIQQELNEALRLRLIFLLPDLSLQEAEFDRSSAIRKLECKVKNSFLEAQGLLEGLRMPKEKNRHTCLWNKLASLFGRDWRRHLLKLEGHRLPSLACLAYNNSYMFQVPSKKERPSAQEFAGG